MGADNLNDDAFKTIGTMTNLTGLQIECTRLTDADLKNFALTWRYDALPAERPRCAWELVL